MERDNSFFIIIIRNIQRETEKKGFSFLLFFFKKSFCSVTFLLITESQHTWTIDLEESVHLADPGCHWLGLDHHPELGLGLAPDLDLEPTKSDWIPCRPALGWAWDGEACPRPWALDLEAPVIEHWVVVIELGPTIVEHSCYWVDPAFAYFDASCWAHHTG